MTLTTTIAAVASRDDTTVTYSTPLDVTELIVSSHTRRGVGGWDPVSWDFSLALGSAVTLTLKATDKTWLGGGALDRLLGARVVVDGVWHTVADANFDWKNETVTVEARDALSMAEKTPALRSLPPLMPNAILAVIRASTRNPLLQLDAFSSPDPSTNDNEYSTSLTAHEDRRFGLVSWWMAGTQSRGRLLSSSDIDSDDTAGEQLGRLLALCGGGVWIDSATGIVTFVPLGGYFRGERGLYVTYSNSGTSTKAAEVVEVINISSGLDSLKTRITSGSGDSKEILACQYGAEVEYGVRPVEVDFSEVPEAIRKQSAERLVAATSALRRRLEIKTDVRLSVGERLRVQIDPGIDWINRPNPPLITEGYYNSSNAGVIGYFVVMHVAPDIEKNAWYAVLVETLPFDMEWDMGWIRTVQTYEDHLPRAQRIGIV